MDVFDLVASDNEVIRFRRWLPDGDPQALLIIAHGMAEHSARYDGFARFMNQSGFAVYAPDHRGNGLTAGSEDQLGYFSITQGWEKVVEDLIAVKEIASSEYIDKPLFILGHSMGSFLVRDLLARAGKGISAAILSGSSFVNSLNITLMKRISSSEIARYGDRYRSEKIHNLSFGAYNRKFRPNRTDCDWLSRDEEQVDLYCADPLCGFVSTSGFYNDLSRGLAKIIDYDYISRTPEELAILFFSGEKDPLFSGIPRLMKMYRRAGLTDLTLHLNKGGRHESLHETNRDEVYKIFRDYLLTYKN